MKQEKVLIAAVESFKQLEKLEEYEGHLKAVFVLFGNISNIASIVASVNNIKVPCYVHIERIEGLKIDDYAFKYLRNNIKVKGIITTKAGDIKRAHKEGLEVVQRSFIVDTRMLKLTLKGLEKHRPEYLEVMPALVSDLIPDIKKKTDIPVITGGLVNYDYVYDRAVASGADAVSTSNVKMWKYISNK